MELSYDELRTAARRWDAMADRLAEAAGLLRAAPTTGLGPAAGEAALLLEAVEAAVSRIRAGADRVVDGLVVTGRLVADADDRSAAGLARLDPDTNP